MTEKPNDELELKQVKPCIVANLPDDEYHSMPGLSKTGMFDLLKNPEAFYDTSSWVNPNPNQRKEPSEAMAFGTLMHLVHLENERFNEKVVRNLSEEDFKGKIVLHTIDDMKAALDFIGLQYKKSSSSTEFAELIFANRPDCVPFKYMKAKFEAENEGKQVVDSYTYDHLMTAYGRMRMDRALAAYLYGSNGMSEVSVFYNDEETGTPMKARFDRLVVRDYDGGTEIVIVDYKTINSPRHKTFEDACYGAIKWEGYDLQCAHYTLSMAAIKKGLIDGSVTARGISTPMLEKIKSANRIRYLFIFQQNHAPFSVFATFIPPRSEASTAFGNGTILRSHAIGLFTNLIKEYGSSPWIKIHQVDEDIPSLPDDKIFYGIGGI